MSQGDERPNLAIAERRHPWVHVPRMDAMVKSIIADVDDAYDTEDKPIFVLSGPTGIGKTVLLRELGFRIATKARVPNTHDSNFRFKPFVQSILSTGSGPAQVAMDVRLSMGLPTPTTFYRVAPQKAREGLEQLSTAFLAIEHVNAILNQGIRTQQDSLNVIKFLSVTASIPIILSGTMKPEALFTRLNDPAGELGSRAIYYSLDRWQNNTDFQKLLIGFGEAYGLDEPQMLGEPDLALLILDRSYGLTRRVCRGIRKAHRLAKEQGTYLQGSHFEAAFKQMTPP